MPVNVEIKTVLRDRASVEAIAARLSDGPPQLIRQEDVFFRCSDGRLKLRIFDRDRGELIRYHRSDQVEVRQSRYLIAQTSNPEALREILAETLGETGLVRKERTLYMIGQTRVHLDRVEGLGEYLELEVVLRDGQTDAKGFEVASALLAKFGIEREDWLGDAYVDLLNKRAKAS